MSQLLSDIERVGTYLGQAMRLMVGLPDYPAYLRHMQSEHPDQAVMDYETFFRERQSARFGGGDGKISRCC